MSSVNMNGVAPFGSAVRPDRAAEPRAAGPPPATGNWAADRVELSPAALARSPGVSGARINELRQAIAAGTYLTSDKLEIVADRLASEFRAQGQRSGRVSA
jgi:anti-sigma28 factor (negative regulator of flagellin synthesis)